MENKNVIDVGSGSNSQFSDTRTSEFRDINNLQGRQTIQTHIPNYPGLCTPVDSTACSFEPKNKHFNNVSEQGFGFGKILV